MRNTYLKHIAVIFFICLFLLKGVGSLVPGLSVHFSKWTSQELVDSEAGNNKKNTEGKAENELKEYYLHHQLINTVSCLDAGCPKDIALRKTIYRQTVYIAIPTPPPKQLN